MRKSHNTKVLSILIFTALAVAKTNGNLFGHFIRLQL